MTAHVTRTERTINCRGCWKESRCVVELTFNETGRVTDARVAGIPSGWAYRPYGDAGGEAPYCPSCLAQQD